MDIAKIEGRRDIVKDRRSGAILNQDKQALDDYLARRTILETAKHSDTEINILKNEVSGIKSDISEIKQLLWQIVHKPPELL